MENYVTAKATAFPTGNALTKSNEMPISKFQASDLAVFIFASVAALGTTVRTLRGPETPGLPESKATGYGID